MPVQPCTTNGKKGWRYGTSGKCYTGPGAKRKAHVQGYAIEQSQKRSGKAAEVIKSMTKKKG